MVVVVVVVVVVMVEVLVVVVEMVVVVIRAPVISMIARRRRALAVLLLLCLSSRLPQVLPNSDLEELVETSDEWIASRTGIRKRHLLDKVSRPRGTTAVSYTHLTLPTICSV